ncbi:hypothetical protein BGZ52_008172, partial [Haplosporangium bisporale]
MERELLEDLELRNMSQIILEPADPDWLGDTTCMGYAPPAELTEEHKEMTRSFRKNLYQSSCDTGVTFSNILLHKPKSEPPPIFKHDSAFLSTSLGYNVMTEMLRDDYNTTENVTYNHQVDMPGSVARN